MELRLFLFAWTIWSKFNCYIVYVLILKILSKLTIWKFWSNYYFSAGKWKMLKCQKWKRSLNLGSLRCFLTICKDSSLFYVNYVPKIYNFSFSWIFLLFSIFQQWSALNRQTDAIYVTLNTNKNTETSYLQVYKFHFDIYIQ